VFLLKRDIISGKKVILSSFVRTPKALVLPLASISVDVIKSAYFKSYFTQIFMSSFTYF
jgi:hypothetical protein